MINIQLIREKIARQNVFHFAGAIRKTVGLSYKPGGRI
jgi:hypothetical protein